jgi:hypothetical protein
MIVKENIYTLAMAYGLAKKQLAYYRKTNQRYYVKMYEGIIISFEERFRNINEDIDLLSYFGETA